MNTETCEVCGVVIHEWSHPTDCGICDPSCPYFGVGENNMELSREIVVFCYGTLKEGHSNHGFLKSAHPLGIDSVGGFEMYSLGPFPAVVRASENDIVHGETYLVNEHEFESLDMLEGYPDFYNRMQVWTEELGELAWIYYQSHPPMHGTLVEGGIW